MSEDQSLGVSDVALNEFISSISRTGWDIQSVQLLLLSGITQRKCSLLFSEFFYLKLDQTFLNTNSGVILLRALLGRSRNCPSSQWGTV